MRLFCLLRAIFPETWQTVYNVKAVSRAPFAGRNDHGIFYGKIGVKGHGNLYYSFKYLMAHWRGKRRLWQMNRSHELCGSPDSDAVFAQEESRESAVFSRYFTCGWADQSASCSSLSPSKSYHASYFSETCCLYGQRHGNRRGWSVLTKHA